MLHQLAVILASILFVGCARTERYFLRDGQLTYFHATREPAPPADTNTWTKSDLRRCSLYAAEGHRIEPGEHIVLLIRHWDPGFPATDDESFEKISVEIDDARIGEVMSLPSPTARVYYSHGSSAWAHRMCGRFADEATGSLVIHTLDPHQATVHMRITFEVKTMLAHPDEPEYETKTVEGEFTFGSLNVSQLNPWLGTVATTIHEELYPND